MEILKIRKLSSKASESEPKGTKREPKGSQMEPKGNQLEPKGSRREPKGSPKGAKGSPKGAQREPKGDQNGVIMEPKLDPGAMSEKGHQKVTKMTSQIDHFGSNFPLKIDEQIDAKIDAEKLMKIYENQCQHHIKH